jgi:integrase
MPEPVLKQSECKTIQFKTLSRVGRRPAHERVEPITDKYDISRVKAYLMNYDSRYLGQNMRNACMFIFGINLGLRAGDLLTLRYCDVLDCKGNPRAQFAVTEQKTGKVRYLTANKAALKSLELLMSDSHDWRMDEYIFKSRQGSNKPISLRRMNQIMKDVQRELNLPYNLGTHSCRKTFGYWFFEENQETPESLAYLSEEFNHSSERITRRYIGLNEKKRKEMRENLNLE